MIIGLDFDNTIVSYENVFHKVALEKGHIDESVARTKLAVRDNLRARDMEDMWTKMQGYVYGACMDQADIFPGVIDALRWARDNGIQVVIVSHKTRFPFMGPKYDLHKAAREWIENTLKDGQGPLIMAENVNFRETKEEKISRISEIGCHAFIDDLPEILLAPAFPPMARRFLFDPGNGHEAIDGVVSVESWGQFVGHLKS